MSNITPITPAEALIVAAAKRAKNIPPEFYAVLNEILIEGVKYLTTSVYEHDVKERFQAENDSKPFEESWFESVIESYEAYGWKVKWYQRNTQYGYFLFDARK